MAIIEIKSVDAYASETNEDGLTTMWEANCLVCNQLNQARVVDSKNGKILNFDTEDGTESNSCEHLDEDECSSIYGFEFDCMMAFGINWSHEEKFLDGSGGPEGGY